MATTPARSLAIHLKSFFENPRYTASSVPHIWRGLHSTTKNGSVDPVDPTRAVNRLLYRSKQRGWLELDLLMGMWAESELSEMSTCQLKAYSDLLDEENPDLFKWLTGQAVPPEHMTSNPAFQRLKGHVASQLEEHATVSTLAGKEWVRGWDDAGNK